jgi:hypothetical protein
MAYRRDAEHAEKVQRAEKEKSGICFSLRNLCALRASAVKLDIYG